MEIAILPVLFILDVAYEIDALPRDWVKDLELKDLKTNMSYKSIELSVKGNSLLNEEFGVNTAVLIY